jgi:hypothetical protein
MNAMLDCSNRDIVAARTLHNEIKNLLKEHERGERHEAMLQEIKVLCSCILQTIHDPYCQEKMCEVEIHSDELFAVDERPRLSRSTQPGSMFLRRLVFKSLEAFDDRLRSLETTRQSARGASETKAAIGVSL